MPNSDACASHARIASICVFLVTSEDTVSPVISMCASELSAGNCNCATGTSKCPVQMGQDAVDVRAKCHGHNR